MIQTTSEKSRDQHARRRLRRLGYALLKARPSGQWANFRPYVIVEVTGDPSDWRGRMLVADTLSIEDVEAWLDEAEATR